MPWTGQTSEGCTYDVAEYLTSPRDHRHYSLWKPDSERVAYQNQ